MARKKGRLGQGYEALFVDNSTEGLNEKNITHLPLTEIEPNRNQPRKLFNDEELNSLAESIAQHGILQPIVVRPDTDGSYKIVAGERRWRASRIAGLAEVPVIIRPMSDEEASFLALVENLQRTDLSPLEEARGYRNLMDEFGIAQEEVAEKVGKSRSAVANAVRLLNLPEKVAIMLEEGKISAGVARALLSLPTESKMIDIAKIIIDKNMNVREAEDIVRRELALLQGKPRRLKPMHSDVFFAEVEIALKNTLKREVSVKEKKEGGKLIIEYFDKEDLAKLARLLED
jgi:ParB family chromosome partitioning protein